MSRREKKVGKCMNLRKNGAGEKLRAFFETDKPLYILLVLVVLERLLYAWQFGADAILVTIDSVHYYEAGLAFAETGMLTYNGFLSALIMPGPTVIIGLLARVFQAGEPLMRAIQIVWLLLGSLTTVYLYKTVKLFAPNWAALLTAAAYLLPSHVAIDNYLMTEGPFYLFFAMTMYYMFKLGQDKELKSAFFCGLSALGGLMFRANITSFLLFALLYWVLLRKFSLKELLIRAGIICCVLAVFILPWTVRNYLRFGDFIPVTYGVGNPILDGTFYGDMCPVEEELDYVAAEEEFQAKYAAYFDENGQIKDPQQQQYLDHMQAGIIANYRLREWFEREPVHFLKTYLIVKPRQILNWPWYWSEFMGVSYQAIHRLTQLNFLFCGLTVLLSLLMKKYRKQVFFLTFCYFVNLYMVAFALPIDRYAQMLMPYRYIIAGLGLALTAEAIQNIWTRRRKTV